MLEKALVFSVTTVLMWAVGCGANTPKPISLTPEENVSRVLKTREDVMALHDTASSWLEAKHGGAKFLFCEADLPAYGSSKIDIHGWVFRSHSEQWESLFSVRTNSVGELELSVDSHTGIFSAKGTANNKFKDHAVFTFDLNATEI